MNISAEPDDDLGDELSEIELAAIECHKYYLSEAAGYDVGFCYARQHWLQHHSRRWRHLQFRRDLRLQMAEMRKYRWIKSEKIGRDLGQAAEIEWIRKFASQWRRRRDRRHPPNGKSDPEE